MTKTIKVSELTEKSRAFAVAKILTVRDEIQKIGVNSAQTAWSDWQRSAPYKTGRLRNSVTLTQNKSNAQLVAGERMRLVNILNSRKRHQKTAGFYDKWKSRNGRAFFSQVTTKVK